MNLLHGIVLVLLCAVILMDVKVPASIQSLGKVPVTITLLFLVFYLFTKSPILGVIGLGVTSWLYVREFIAVRSLGILFLLAGDVFLDAAFLRDDAGRLVVVSYAYLIIVEGMVMVGAPYLLRDAITWGLATPGRGRFLMALGVIFGVALLGLGLFVY